MGFLKSLGQELTHAVFQRHVPIMPGCDPLRIQQAQQFFYMVDTNMTGTLDHHEFGRVLGCMGLLLPEPAVKQYFHSVDVGCSGRISLNEFINWWCMQGGQQHWAMVPLGIAGPVVQQPVQPAAYPASFSPAYATYPPVVQQPVVYQTPAPVMTQPAAGFAAGVAAGVMMDEMLHHGHHHHGHHHHHDHHHHHGHHW